MIRNLFEKDEDRKNLGTSNCGFTSVRRWNIKYDKYSDI